MYRVYVNVATKPLCIPTLNLQHTCAGLVGDLPDCVIEERMFNKLPGVAQAKHHKVITSDCISIKMVVLNMSIVLLLREMI